MNTISTRISLGWKDLEWRPFADKSNRAQASSGKCISIFSMHNQRIARALPSIDFHVSLGLALSAQVSIKHHQVLTV